MVFLTAMMNSNPGVEAYVGTWTWEETTVSGRGGKSTTTAEETKIIKQLVIAADGTASLLESGKETCSASISLEETDGPNGGFDHSIVSDCIKGSIGIKDGKLIHYQYLGCPSSLSTYAKAE